jgi:hypothetical protein
VRIWLSLPVFLVSFVLGTTVFAADEEIPLGKQQMNLLADRVVNETLAVVAQSGGFMPYGLLMDNNETVRLIGFNKKDTGQSKDDMAISLFWQIRKIISDSDDVIAAAMVKPHHVEATNGEIVPGIWATIDHKDYPAWVVFLPFLKNESGTFSVGEIQYLPAKEALFLDTLNANKDD